MLSISSQSFGISERGTISWMPEASFKHSTQSPRNVSHTSCCLSVRKVTVTSRINLIFMRKMISNNRFSSSLVSGLISIQRNNTYDSYDSSDIYYIIHKYFDAVRPLTQTVNRFHFYPSPTEYSAEDACCPAIMTHLRGSFGTQGRPGLSLGHSARYLLLLPRGRHSPNSLRGGSDNDCLLRTAWNYIFPPSTILGCGKLSHNYNIKDFLCQALTLNWIVI